jgi:methionine-rich copper-binding protein CopC
MNKVYFNEQAMRGKAIVLFLAVCAYAGTTLAFPQIVIYNYLPPAPALQLVSQKPKDHQGFSTPPEAVSLSFTMAIDPDNSELAVYDPYNNIITHGKTMPKDNVMTLSLPAKLYSGTYRIEWKATCQCNENSVISGTSYFTVY